MHSHAELTGYLAAALTTLSFLPQVWKTLRTRDTQAISLGMYLMFSAGVAQTVKQFGVLRGIFASKALGIELIGCGAAAQYRFKTAAGGWAIGFGWQLCKALLRPLPRLASRRRASCRTWISSATPTRPGCAVCPPMSPTPVPTRASGRGRCGSSAPTGASVRRL